MQARLQLVGDDGVDEAMPSHTCLSVKCATDNDESKVCMDPSRGVTVALVEDFKVGR